MGSAAEGRGEFESRDLHRATSKPGTAKLSFGSPDVKRTRQELLLRGARVGRLNEFGDLVLCDGEDPERNRFLISSHRES
ncbi:MAG TPA: hypothetical protein VKU80_17375 [Planctomycetota bacterium]|nr:hypothetical protein [Planctomycetota bacterium]